MAESPHFTTLKRRNSIPLPPDLRLVLVGKTGSGKSSSGNTIMGKDIFTAAVSHLSVTRECCKKKGEVLDRKVTIVDTPGLFDTSQTDDTVHREISKCINMSAPGPHAILLVIKLGPFTAEERDAVKKVKEIFGRKAWTYTIVLFTHGDKIKTDFDQMLAEAGDQLQTVLKKVRNRYHVINNLKINDRGQVLDLFKMVDNMVVANGGQFYTNPTYLEATKMLDQRESELRIVYQKKLETEIKAVESRYETKLREAQEKRQEVEEQLKSELQEVKRYYHTLESGVRYVVEQTTVTDSFEKVLSNFHETLKLQFTS